MSSLTIYQQNAELALAAYAENLFTEISQSAYRDALEAGGTGMSQTQADRFASVWFVVDQFADSSTGVSATIFQKGTEISVAIRGTQFEASDLLANLTLALGVSERLNPQFDALRTKMDEWLGVGQPLYGKSFSVAGHSLGGYLAAAIKEAYSANVTAAYLFNAPGSGGIVGNIADLVSGLFSQPAPGANGIWNIKASEGISFITGLGSQPSAGIPVHIEAAPGFGLGNHSIERLSDATAVQAVYSTLAPSLTSSQLNALVDASGNPTNQTLESALDALRSLLLGTDAAPTPVDGRDAFYANIQALMESTEYAELAAASGTELIVLAGTPAPAVLDLADDSGDHRLAVHYALKALDPFAFIGADYSTFNADGALNPYDPLSQGNGLTQQYLADRANFLERKLWFSTEDINTVDLFATYDPEKPTSFANELASNFFLDAASGYDIRLGPLFASTHIYAFGDGKADVLTGRDLEDHLYGGGGRDILTGGEGDNDYLEGGAGLDVYRFLSGDGVDTVLDADGTGILIRNGLGFALGMEVSPDVWQLGGTTYTRNGSDLEIRFADNASDKITLRDFDFGQAQARGYLGIRLVDAPVLPTETSPLVGDKTPIDADPGAEGVQIGYDLWGNELTEDPQIARDDALYGRDNASDHIQGREGDDIIYGDTAPLAQPGPRTNPVSSAVGAADLIEGGAGRDIVTAGAGEDWAEGGADGDILAGNAGNDTIYANSSNGQTLTLGQAIALGESEQPTAGLQDLVTGDAGNDILVSSSGADYLAGGEGSDVIAGGGGDDTIYGDRTVTAAPLDWSVTRVVDEIDDVNVYSVLTSAGFASTEGEGAGDVIYAGAGDDWVFAGGADDYVEAGSGLNVVLGEAGNDTIIGGADRDILDGDSADANNVGTYGDDYLDGAGGDDTLFGGKGHDILIGGAGQDQLIGGDGDDVLHGGAETDVLQGGAGKDTYLYFRNDGYDIVIDPDITTGSQYLSRVILGPGITKADVKFRLGSLVIDLGEGDALQFIGFNAEDLLSTPMLDSIQFSDGDVMTYADILAQGFTIDGTEGDDVDASFIEGTEVRDLINAKGGNDVVVARGGADEILGGAGDDDIDAGEGDDVVDGGDGADSIEARGGNDVVTAGDGNDVVFGGAGDDELTGGGGADTLAGGHGADDLSGGLGDDFLDGGGGNDVLAGGEDVDTYLLQGRSGLDVVTDGAGGETNVIRLGAGLTLDNIAATREGDALKISLRGLSDALLVQDYYTQAQSWLVRDEAGTDTPVEDVINRPDPYAGDFIGRLWADAKLGHVADVLGQVAQGGAKPLGGTTFQTLVEPAWLEARSQTTTETYTRVAAPYDVLASYVTQTSSYEVESFGLLDAPLFRWFQAAFETGRQESDAATIFGNSIAMPQEQTPGEAVVTLKYEPRLLNVQNIQSSQSGGVVSYDTGSETVLANVRYDYDIRNYNRIGNVVGVDPDPGPWGPPRNTVVGNRVLADMAKILDRYRIVNEIVAGDSANSIFTGNAGSFTFTMKTLVDAGGGDDQIFGSGLLYGNAGADRIQGFGSILIGGDGNDELIGRDGTRFVYLATEAGIDRISETTEYGQAYLNWFYGNLGIGDWEYRAQYGGQYAVPFGDGGIAYFDSYEEAFAAFPGGEISFIEPLPALAPAVRSIDTAALDALIQAGVMPRDVVQFGPGLALAGLDLMVTVPGISADEYPERPWHGGGTLSVRWGPAGFDVGLSADADYQVGEGIESFEFADGSSYSLEQILAQAVVVPRYRFEFLRGSGSQVIEGEWTGVDFGPDVLPAEVTAQRDGNDLVFRLTDSSAEGRITGWYADPAAVPPWRFHFADGTVLDTDSVTRLGLTQYGSDGFDFLQADGDFASALYGLEGEDYLSGGAGNDLLDPGLAGAFGSAVGGDGGDDIYIFGAGYGDVAVSEQALEGASGDDVVRFTGGIAPDDVSVEQDYGYLVFTVGAGGDVLTFQDWFEEPGGTVERVEFQDGTIWDAATLAAMVPSQDTATEGDDSLLGKLGDDLLEGLDGDDEIYGYAGDDALAGGAGFDYLAGGQGDDTYAFSVGDGEDSIHETGGYDRLVFGPGIAAADLQAERDESSVRLTVGEGGGNTLYLADWFEDAGNRIEEIVFNDGTVWTSAQIAALIALAGVALAGTESDDTLVGGEGPDQITGLGGDDTLDGGAGKDTYVFSVGDGVDTIADAPSGAADASVIVFGPGIFPNHLEIALGSLILEYGEGDAIHFSAFDADDPYSAPVFERVEFDDGSVMSYEEVLDLGFTFVGADGDDVIFGTGANDFIVGEAGSDALYGLGGDDSLLGSDGDDTLAAGRGEDGMYGELGSDTYIYAPGDGYDQIAESTENPGDVDTLRLTGGILPADIRVTRDVWSYYLVFDGTDRLVIDNMAREPAAVVERIEFDDGTVWTPDDLAARVELLPGTPLADALWGSAGNDTLEAFGGDDQLFGNGGNDVLVGGEGSDLYYFATGDGADVVDNYDTDASFDTIYFADASSTDATLAKSGNDLVIRIGDGSDRVTLSGWYSGADRKVDEVVFVGDFVGWDAATLELLAPAGGGNSAPAVSIPIADQAAQEDSAFTFIVAADAFSDPAAGDTLIYTAEQMPAWLSFNAETRTFSGTPLQAHVGSVEVRVVATDSGGLSAEDTFTLTVANVNDAPVVTAADVAVLRNEAVAASTLFSVSDADADSIVQYEFWDDVGGGGYFSLEGVAQGNNPIAVSAAQLAGLQYVGGADPGTEQVWVRASDGMDWSAWKAWNMTSALHLPNAAPEVAAPASQVVLLNGSISASSQFTATDADGDPIAQYEFWDSTAGNGHFAVNGVEQGVNVAIPVADLENVEFIGASSTAYDLVWVRASDGQTWSDWKSWTVNSWPHATNAAPVVSASDATILTNEAAEAGSLFAVTDADGDAIATYEFWDDVNGGGYFSVDGVQQAAGVAIAVAAADLADTDYVGGASGGTERVWVRANDGLEWSAWKPWNMTSALHIPNAAPVVSASDHTMLLGATVDASALFSVADADNDVITQYEFWDSTPGNGRFTVGGVEQGVNVAISVTATQLASTEFAGSPATASDLVWVRANDGQTWSDWKSWTVNSWPHLANSAPVVSAANDGLLRAEAVSAAGLFSVTDADGDSIARYELWDDVNGGGYWRLNGVQQAAGQAIAVTAAELADADYLGGANAGTEQVWARAFDGLAWGAWKNWLMATEGGMLRGGLAPDTLAGEAGPTVLEGGGGDDSLTDTEGNNVLSGGEGADVMTGGDGADLFAGGAGDDAVYTGAGANVIAYNAGGGLDAVYSSAGATNTLSFGGGIAYDDLTLSKDGNDLIVNTGTGEGVVLKDWYAGANNVLNLQIMLDASDAFDANSADPLYNKKVQSFDFLGLVSEFDQALSQSPGLTSWAVTNALLQFHLSGADDAAIGGDLAYWYGKNGGFTGISLAAAQQVIGAAGFGSDAQSLRPFGGLQEGLVKLA